VKTLGVVILLILVEIELVRKQGTIKSYQGKSIFATHQKDLGSAANKQLTLLDFLLKFNLFLRVFS
jgi:hypothetical protein